MAWQKDVKERDSYALLVFDPYKPGLITKNLANKSIHSRLPKLRIHTLLCQTVVRSDQVASFMILQKDRNPQTKWSHLIRFRMFCLSYNNEGLIMAHSLWLDKLPLNNLSQLFVHCSSRSLFYQVLDSRSLHRHSMRQSCLSTMG